MKIEGFFSSIKTANETVSKLKSEGYNEVFVDINEHYNNAYSERGLLGTENISSLSEAVLGSGNNRGQGVNSPLAAASPMVSGMGGFEEIANINCKVVVEVGNKDTKTAKKIISDMGGELENLNTKIPKGLENIGVEELILGNIEE
ncbi:hypothetical protein CPJCM30710_03340 [Clostridium polyendosporum]|uniref:Heat induced stress protein YflT n=1 Tax=Clostridium polyendosporum TaxID=69208 RepID=A0A919RZ59_9CLOT|nr:hypothetical protein [Clostridium polyendosporum]GIM27668.1 hypothetical protein CPJCM30710_03340 [Clostridium polyendosporum]